MVRLHLPVRSDDDAHPARIRRLEVVTRTVGEPDLPIGVAQQWEVEPKLLSEVLVLLGCIEADAQNLCVLLLILRSLVAEPVTLGRSTRARNGLPRG